MIACAETQVWQGKAPQLNKTTTRNNGEIAIKIIHYIYDRFLSFFCEKKVDQQETKIYRIKRQCPLSVSEIANIWHMAQN